MIIVSFDTETKVEHGEIKIMKPLLIKISYSKIFTGMIFFD